MNCLSCKVTNINKVYIIGFNYTVIRLLVKTNRFAELSCQHCSEQNIAKLSEKGSSYTY